MDIYLQNAGRLLRRGKERGSATIEATISVLAFLFVMLALLYLINFGRAQMLIQTALDKTALQISQYMYLYRVSGLYNVDITIQDRAEQTAGEIDHTVAGGERAVNNVENIAKSLSALGSGVVSGGKNGAAGLDFSALKETAGQIAGEAGDLKENVQTIINEFKSIKGDPIAFLRGLAACGTDFLLDTGKNYFLGNLLARSMFLSNLETETMSANDRLLALGVVNGEDGMDFSRSRILSKDANSANPQEDINIVVTYQVELIPILKLGGKLSYAQSASVRAWLGGNQGSAKKLGTNKNPSGKGS